jgi:MFS family permease
LSPEATGAVNRSARTTDHIIALIGTGHFLSHFYMICLPPLFVLWRAEFGVPYATVGLSLALMAATTGLLPDPIGFWVDKYGSRPFLVGGTLLMALSISAMAFAVWQSPRGERLCCGGGRRSLQF